MAHAAKEYCCPLCDYEGRSDHLTRHIQAVHKDKDKVLAQPMPPGLAWVAVETNPMVIYKEKKEGESTTYPEGVCFACGHHIRKKLGRHDMHSSELFEGHICKDKQVRSKPVPVKYGNKTVMEKMPVVTLTAKNITDAHALTNGAFNIECNESDVVRPMESFNNIVQSLKKLYAENRSLKASSKRVAGAADVWKALQDANIPGFEKEDDDSDVEQTASYLALMKSPESIASTIAKEIEGFRKEIDRAKNRVKKMMEAEMTAVKEHADKKLEEQAMLITENEKKLGEQARLILKNQDELKHKDRLIKKLMDELSTEEAAAESDSDTEAVVVAPTPVKKKIFMKNEIQSKDHRTKLTQLNLV
jgi:hypothetical protein